MPNGLLGPDWSDPRTAGLLGLSTGLLQGSGPSRFPVPFAQPLAQGLLQSNELQMAARRANVLSDYTNAQTQNVMLENEMRRRQLEAPPTTQFQKLGAEETLFGIDPTGAISPVARGMGKAEKPQEQWGPIEMLGGVEVQKNLDTGQYRQAVTRPPQPPQINLAVNTAGSLWKSVADKAGENVAAKGAAAQDAVRTIQSADQIRDAIEAGGVIAGPGATLRLQGAQISQMLGFTGPDAVVSTRNAIQGLAKLALGARAALKGQGQISDYEGKLLMKAETGDVSDLTLPEIKSIADVADRGARLTIKQNRQNVEKLKGKPETGPLSEFLDVPEPPERKSKATPVRRGKYQGRNVIEYSDGRVEYAD